MLSLVEHEICCLSLGPDLGQIKKSVFRVTGLKILARVGTHNIIFFWIK